MLILSRKLGESIVIDGHIHVTVMRVDGEVVKLGIAAPAEVPVHRKEVYEEIQRNNQQALTKQSATLPKLAGVMKKKPAASPITNAPAVAAPVVKKVVPKKI
jgi:carbon storage regulator